MGKSPGDIGRFGMNQAIEKLKECAHEDIETRHMLADEVLCELLKQLGYQEVVEEYEKLPKWYA